MQCCFEFCVVALAPVSIGESLFTIIRIHASFSYQATEKLTPNIERVYSFWTFEPNTLDVLCAMLFQKFYKDCFAH